MKQWDTDKIIGAGLIGALLLKVCCDALVTLYGLNVPASELATNIVAGLSGYMGRTLLDKVKHHFKEEE